MKVILDNNIWISFLIGKIDKPTSAFIRDAKDLYLLSLAERVQADYMVTGDKDLLVLENHESTRILSFPDFKLLFI